MAINQPPGALGLIGIAHRQRVALVRHEDPVQQQDGQRDGGELPRLVPEGVADVAPTALRHHARELQDAPAQGPRDEAQLHGAVPQLAPEPHGARGLLEEATVELHLLLEGGKGESPASHNQSGDPNPSRRSRKASKTSS